MVSVDSIDDLARFILRADGVGLDAAAAFGLPMPRAACRAEAAAGRAALWLGPDEFLLLCPLREFAPARDALAWALASHPHALVDVTHRQQALRVSGAGAAHLLNTGCPLDLHVDAFPLNACTRTVLGRSEVTLWRTGGEMFHLEVARSYMPYVRLFLAEARLGLA